MKQLISIVLAAAIITTPAHILAQETEDKPKISNLKQGDRAPFDGILLDAWGFAEIMAKMEIDEERFKLELDYLGKKKDAEWGLKYDSLQASFDSLKFKYDNVIEIKDNEIQVLRQIAVEKKDYSMWWYAGGFLSGVALCLGVLYVSASALSN
tara:strand:+ start:777 stop:1235 length:459 start_codon:yes stop_codon:yes gene_type:complete